MRACHEQPSHSTPTSSRYRYQVLTVVVPLINVIWAGV